MHPRDGGSSTNSKIGLRWKAGTDWMCREGSFFCITCILMGQDALNEAEMGEIDSSVVVLTGPSMRIKPRYLRGKALDKTL
jgi:hypothetical protein